MELGGLAFALIAGVLSTLSPCVVPLLPIILGTAAGEHRLGPAALAAGLALSFVAIGLFIATIGFAIGLDENFFRIIAAVLLIGIGAVLLVPPLQTQLVAAAAPVTTWADSRFGGVNTQGLQGQFALGLLLGAVWSPCVGPTLGPAALAAGLALSFVAIGLFIATIGFAIGLDENFFRIIAAVLLIGIGAVLLLPPLQTQLVAAAAPVTTWADSRFGGVNTQGLQGQFALGLLLGAVWSPCVGPTLGAASLLASQGKDLGQVALVMAAFGVGAAMPLLLLGMASREAMQRWRGRLLETGKAGKVIMGVLLVCVGLLVASGLDKSLETALVDASPVWLTNLTTRY